MIYIRLNIHKYIRRHEPVFLSAYRKNPSKNIIMVNVRRIKRTYHDHDKRDKQRIEQYLADQFCKSSLMVAGFDKKIAADENVAVDCAYRK